MLALAYFLIAKLGHGPFALIEHLGDSDDATRLVSVRDLLAGAPWFDTTLPRIGAPEPLLSHWSRLIDLPLASGMIALQPFFGGEAAELAMRIVWPTFLLFALMLVVTRDVQLRSGTAAAVLAVLFVVTCETALVQFQPGRIDHHNVQILCAVAGVLLLARGLKDEGLGRLAGLFFGLGLACGLEAVALVIPALALAALLSLRDQRFAPGVLAAATSTTAVLFVALIATVAPSRWLDIRCDALSLNLPLLALLCTCGLWAALRTSLAYSFRSRYGVAAGAAFAGLGIYAWLEPACLAGPMGQLNPGLNSWLGEVMETRSAFWLTAHYPAAGLSFLVFVAGGCAAQLALFRRRPNIESGYRTAIVLLAVLLGCWQIRLMSYSSWLIIPALAIWCANLRGSASISRPVAILSAAVFLSQMGIGLIVGTAVAAVRQVGPLHPVRIADVGTCYQASSLRPLATLPPGLVAADIDLGPFIVATTGHRVVAAPYHRLDQGIIAAQAILREPPEKALATMRALRADYLVLCAVPNQVASTGSMRAALLAGAKIPSLTEIGMPPGSPIQAWRILDER